MCVSQEDTTAGEAAEGSGRGGPGLLQPGKHLHAAPGLRESHRLPPQTPHHSPGPQRQVHPVCRVKNPKPGPIRGPIRVLKCVFGCRIGEGRACWSLGNAHTALGNHDQAMHFAEKHLEICKEVKESSLHSLLLSSPQQPKTSSAMCVVLLDWRPKRGADGSYERL